MTFRKTFSFFDRTYSSVYLGVTNWRNNFKNKEELIAENNRLLATVVAYENDMASYEILKKENAELLDSETVNLAVARVLSKGNLPFSSIILIENKNFSPKQKVFTGSIYLGEISEIFRNTAILELQSRSGNEIVGVLSSGLEVALKSKGNQTFNFEVLNEEDIYLGEDIKLAGSNFLLAKVREIVVDPKTPYKKIVATVPVNLNYLQFVSVDSNE